MSPCLTGIEAARAALRFVPLPRFPPSKEISRFVLADGVRLRKSADAIRSLAFPNCETIEAADLFRGGQIPAGKFSLMIRVTFQSAQATLTDAQLADFSSRIVAALEEAGATLRAS